MDSEFENSLCERLNVALKGKKLKHRILEWCKFICKAHLKRIKDDFIYLCEKGDEYLSVHLTNINSYEIKCLSYRDLRTGEFIQTKDTVVIDPEISTIEEPGSLFPKITVKELIDTGIALPLLSSMLGSKCWVNSYLEDAPPNKIAVATSFETLYIYKTIRLEVTFFPFGLSNEMKEKIENAKNT
jgi:hypothetical protein